MQSLNALATKFAWDLRIVRAFLIVSPALIVFLCDLFGHQGDLAPQVALRLTGAQLMHQGLTPYIDFWDWSQPADYWLASIPYLINAAVESIPYYIPPEQTFKTLVFLLAVLSMFLTLSILSCGARQLQSEPGQGAGAGAGAEAQAQPDLKAQIESLFVPVSAGYVLALMCTRFEFAVLQQIFMLTLLPWLTLRWLSYRGLNCQRYFALFIGLVMGLGAILDLPHLPIVIALEIFFVAVSSKVKLDFASLGLGAIGLVDIVCLSMLPSTMSKAFWQWTMPIRVRQFTRFDATLSAYIASPDRRDALYVMAAAIFLGLLLHVKQDFLRPLIVLTVLGLALFVGEGQGLSSDLIVAIWGTCFIVAISVPLILKTALDYFSLLNDKIKWALPAVALLGFVLIMQSGLNRDRDLARLGPMRNKEQGRTDIFEVVNDSSKSGETVIILCDYPAPIYPLLFDLDRKQGSYLLWSRPLRVLNALQHFGLMTAPMREFESFVYKRLELDIDRRESAVVLVAKNTVKRVIAGTSIERALNSGYDLIGECFNCSSNKAPAEYCGFDQAFDIYRRRP